MDLGERDLKSRICDRKKRNRKGMRLRKLRLIIRKA
jgi:hypothetical protein